MTIQLPTEPLIVETPLFVRPDGEVPVEQRWQRWHDQWRNADRDVRWHGNCIGCGRNVYAFDDGDNDPRGVLGDNALNEVELEDLVSETTIDLICCAICANDYNLYHNVLAIGQSQARRGATVTSVWAVQR